MREKHDNRAESERIDFARILYIGVKNSASPEKEVGRMTIAKFNVLYRAYQDDFDLELMMRQRYYIRKVEKHEFSFK